MDLIGRVVKHKSKGKGTITKCDSGMNYIWVQFSDGEIQMQYPKAFEEFLIFVDDSFQIETQQALIKSRYDDKSKKKRQENDMFSIYYKPNLDQKSYRDKYHSENKHSNTTRKKTNTLSQDYSSLKRVIQNAAFDLREPNVMAQAPENKKDYNVFQYEKRWDQACYMLRYTYAYAFEYFQLYMKVLDEFSEEENLAVLSLGCGAMTDAWSLSVASKMQSITHRIEYKGVDKVSTWHSGYIPEADGVIKQQTDFGTGAGSYLMNCNSIDYNIVVFPKSLRDIYLNDLYDYRLIVEALRSRPLSKDKICIAFSLTPNPDPVMNEEWICNDGQKIKELVGCIKNQGYSLKKDPIRQTQSDTPVYYNTGYPEIDDRLKDSSEELTDRIMMTNRRHQLYWIYILERD